MKKYLFLLLVGFFPLLLFSQNTTIILQPGPDEGVDCVLHSMDMFGNYGDIADFMANAWTVSGDSLLNRSLIRFDLDEMPESHLVNATLNLKCNLESGHYQLNSGENSCMIYMVTEPWYEYNATWFNQPSYRTDIFVQTPPVYEEDGDLQNIDMTEMVQYWLDNPEENFGCILMLAEEVHYACMVQSSSDHPDPERRPKLVLEFGDCPNLDLDFPLVSENKTVSVSYETDEIDGVCRWDFGDGTVVTGDSISHTYLSGGTYEIIMEYLTDSCGIYTSSKEICICDQEPDYEYYINYNQPNKIAFFPGDGVVSVYEWDFGDGSYSYESDLIHEFPGPGIYTVCLSCLNQCDENVSVCYDVDIVMTGLESYGNLVESIYPNPTDDKVHIAFTGPQDATIEIHTLAGRKIVEYSVQNQNALEVSVSDFAPGVYIITITGDNHQLLFEKLVVY